MVLSTSRLRRSLAAICIILGGVGTLLFAAATLLSFPLIVIADSDLGASSNRRMRDFGALCLISFAYTLLAILRPLPAALRIACALALLVFAMLRRPDPDNLFVTQCFQLSFAIAIGLLILGLAAGPKLPLWRFILPLLAPPLLLLTCYAYQLSGLRPWSRTAVSYPMRSFGGSPYLEIIPQLSPYSASTMALSEYHGVTSPDGALTAIQNDHDDLELAGPSGKTILLPAQQDLRFNLLLFTHNSRRLIAVQVNTSFEHGSNTVLVWNVSPGSSGSPPMAHIVRQWDVSAGRAHVIVAMALHPNDDTLAISTGDGVEFTSLDTGVTSRAFIPHINEYWNKPDCPDALAFSPDGSMLATWASPHIAIWHYPELTPKRSLFTNDIACGLAFSPDADNLIAVSRNSSSIWQVESHPWVDVLIALAALGIVAICAANVILPPVPRHIRKSMPRAAGV